MQLSRCSVDYEDGGIRKRRRILQYVMMHTVPTHIYGCTCYSLYLLIWVKICLPLYIRFILPFSKDIYSQLLSLAKDDNCVLDHKWNDSSGVCSLYLVHYICNQMTNARSNSLIMLITFWLITFFENTCTFD